MYTENKEGYTEFMHNGLKSRPKGRILGGFYGVLCWFWDGFLILDCYCIMVEYGYGYQIIYFYTIFEYIYYYEYRSKYMIINVVIIIR